MEDVKAPAHFYFLSSAIDNRFHDPDRFQNKIMLRVRFRVAVVVFPRLLHFRHGTVNDFFPLLRLEKPYQFFIAEHITESARNHLDTTYGAVRLNQGRRNDIIVFP